MTDKKNEATPVEAERFIGPRKVEMAIATDYKTHAGNDVVEIRYAGGYRELMPKSEFEFLLTDKPTDWNDLRKRKLGRITKGLLAVLAEHDVKAQDIEAIKQSLETELYNSFNRVTHYLWTKDDKSFIPGNNVVMERSLLEADIVIKSIPTDEQSTPETTESGKDETSGKDA